MDIEGAEHLALKEAVNTLTIKKPKVIIATEHGSRIKIKCIYLIRDLDYRVKIHSNMIYGSNDDIT